MSLRQYKITFIAFAVVGYVLLTAVVLDAIDQFDQRVPPPRAVGLTGEIRDGKLHFRLKESRVDGERISGVFLPRGPDDIGLPGLPGVWEQILAAGAGWRLDSSSGDDQGLQALPSRMGLSQKTIHEMTLPGIILNISREGHLLFLHNDQGNVLVVDTLHPEKPEIVDVLHYNDRVQGMVLHGGLLYLLLTHPKNHSPELVVIRAHGSRELHEIARHRLPGWSNVLVLTGEYLCVASTKRGSKQHSVSIYAVDGNGGIDYLGLSEEAFLTRGTLVDGVYAYTPNSRWGLDVYNLENPLRPVKVRSVDTAERVKSLCRFGDRLFAWSDLSRVLVFDITDPASVQQVLAEEGGTFPVRLLYVEGYTYYVARTGVLSVFDHLPPEILDDRYGESRILHGEVIPARNDEGAVLAGPEQGELPHNIEKFVPVDTGQRSIIASTWWQDRLALLFEGGRVVLYDETGVPVQGVDLSQGKRWLLSTGTSLLVGGDQTLVELRGHSLSNPLERRSVAMPVKETWAAVLLDKSLYLAAGQKGLFRLDYTRSDPRPVNVSRALPRQLAAKVDFRDISLRGRRLYAAAGPAGLIVGSVEGSGDVSLEGVLELGSSIETVAVKEDMVLLSTGQDIRVLNVGEDDVVQEIGAIDYVGVDRIVVCGASEWAGHVPGKGWTVLPLPYRVDPPRVTVGEGEADFALPDVLPGGQYHLGLYNPYGVTKLPGLATLIKTEQDVVWEGAHEGR